LREAIPFEILVTIEHSNCFITTLQIAVQYILELQQLVK